MSAETPEFVYGYGKTKHLPDEFYKADRGLCGAYGGYPLDASHRPLCKHCERIDRQRRVPSTGQNPPGDAQ